MSEGLRSYILTDTRPVVGILLSISFPPFPTFPKLSSSLRAQLKPSHMVNYKMSSSTELQSFSTTLTLIVIAGAVYMIVQAIRRLFFSPTAKFPGPKLAALTYW